MEVNFVEEDQAIQKHFLIDVAQATVVVDEDAFLFGIQVYLAVVHEAFHLVLEELVGNDHEDTMLF